MRHKWVRQVIVESVDGEKFIVFRCPFCKCKRYGATRWLTADRPIAAGFSRSTPPCR